MNFHNMIKEMMKICVGSKKKYAGMWRELRDEGYNIISTWIDNIGRTEKQFVGLSQSCLKEATEAQYLIIYYKPGDFLKGALVEIGAALSAGTYVRCILDTDKCIEVPRMMRHIFNFHPLWQNYSSLESALNGIPKTTLEHKKKRYPFDKKFCSHKNSDKIIGGKPIILHNVCIDCGTKLR